MMIKRFSIWLLSLSLLTPLASFADLTIDIVGGSASQIPIAIPAFKQTQGENIADIVSADLSRSGLFKVLESRGVANQPHTPSDVKFNEWAAIQTQALVVGKVEAMPNNRLKVNFTLLDVLKQGQLTGMEFNITPAQTRLTAHKIADAIYQKMTGEPGVFATRISYVSKVGKRYSLYVADADGANPQKVVKDSTEPIISPAWSPDGNKLAYVSFEKKKPIIYVQSLTSGQRYVLANFKGNNSAPSWSPDGSKLAIVLTYGANSQIYKIDADGTNLMQLTKSSTIDTEPVWSPDGQTIYFTSNRGGAPQIYKVSSGGGDAKRVTFVGSYNVSPRVSPDGKQLAFIKQEGGRFKVAVLDLTNNQMRTLSDTSQDESPSFSPNGRMILYATSVGGRGTLAAVSSDGKTKQRLGESGGDVREPTWGPQE